MDENYQIARYRWEFIRRNQQYREDWYGYFLNPNVEKASELLNRWGPWNFPQSKDFDRHWDKINRIPGTIWSRELQSEEFWPNLEKVIKQLLMCHVIRKPSFVIQPDLIGDPVFLEKAVYSDDNIKASEYYIVRGENVSEFKNSNLPDEIIFKIMNFKSYLYSNDIDQHAFRENIKERVDHQLKLWESASKKTTISHQRKDRHRFSHYDQHLLIWDLVQKNGQNWQKISAEVYPDPEDEESALKTVKNSYKRACILIKKAKSLFIEH